MNALEFIWITVLIAVYVPAFAFIVIRGRRRRHLYEFSHALATILREEVPKSHLDHAIARIESIFGQSALNRSFTSVVGLIEHVHYLVSTDSMRALTKIWDESDNIALQSLWREMDSRQPFSSLSGDSRRLLESVVVAMGTDNHAGSHAVGVLADHIKVTEKRLADQRSNMLVVGAISVAGVILTLVGTVITLLSNT